MPIIEQQSIVPGANLGRPRLAVGFYEFAVDGGAIGDITLRGDSLPLGAVIVNALLHVDTAVTSGGAATLAIKTEAAADIQSAVVVSGAPWSTVGAKRTTFTATTAPVKTTAVRPIIATAGAFALTAGKFTVVITFYTFN